MSTNPTASGSERVQPSTQATKPQLPPPVKNMTAKSRKRKRTKSKVQEDRNVRAEVQASPNSRPKTIRLLTKTDRPATDKCSEKNLLGSFGHLKPRNPVHLSLDMQHQYLELLWKLQEHTFWNWMTTHFPHTLRKLGFLHPRSIEMTKYWGIFSQLDIPEDAIYLRPNAHPLEYRIPRSHIVRNCDVHRTPPEDLPVDRLECMGGVILSNIEAFKDRRRSKVVRQLVDAARELAEHIEAGIDADRAEAIRRRDTNIARLAELGRDIFEATEDLAYCDKKLETAHRSLSGENREYLVSQIQHATNTLSKNGKELVEVTAYQNQLDEYLTMKGNVHEDIDPELLIPLREAIAAAKEVLNNPEFTNMEVASEKIELPGMNQIDEPVANDEETIPADELDPAQPEEDNMPVGPKRVAFPMPAKNESLDAHRSFEEADEDEVESEDTGRIATPMEDFCNDEVSQALNDEGNML